MIGSIKGRVAHIGDKNIIVDVQGVGYKVSVSGDTIMSMKEGSGISLWTHMHVREDALDLYGFITHKELEFFELLIHVSGIGPKGALTILAVASIDVLTKAIRSGDTAYLTKISGIGKKTAEKIVIELRDKVDDIILDEGSESLQGEMDALEALKSLGYSERDAREALKKVQPDTDTNTKIRQALRSLGSK